jgi:hypothetical protein
VRWLTIDPERGRQAEWVWRSNCSAAWSRKNSMVFLRSISVWPSIPVMVAAGWSEAQKRAYVLADNQLAITGSGWDPELLPPGTS